MGVNLSVSFGLTTSPHLSYVKKMWSATSTFPMRRSQCVHVAQGNALPFFCKL